MQSRFSGEWSKRSAGTGTTTNRTDGFSLIELITVVAIISILAAVAIPVYDGIEQRARDSTTLASVRNVASYAYSSYEATGTVSLPPDNLADPESVMIAVVYGNKNDPLSLCAVALGPKAPKPAVYSGPGCDRFDWGNMNPGGKP